jgi:hypothetical protein
MKNSYRLPKCLISFITLGMIAVLPVSVEAEDTTHAVDDSYVYWKATDATAGETNYDLASRGMWLRKHGSSSGGHMIRVGFIKFPLSQVDAETATIVELKLTSSQWPTQGMFNVYATEDHTWTEETITWNNAPARGDLVTLGADSIFNNTSADPDTTIYIDVTTYVLAQVNAGQDYVSFQLAHPNATLDSVEAGSGSLDGRIYAKENYNAELGADSASVHPFLIVNRATVGTENDQTSFPSTFELSQNYPNPFNPSTIISYTVPESGHLQMVIYNLLGQAVYTLVDNQVIAGSHSISWNGMNFAGEQAPAGIYLCHLTAGNTFYTIKMVLMK